MEATFYIIISFKNVALYYSELSMISMWRTLY